MKKYNIENEVSNIIEDYETRTTAKKKLIDRTQYPISLGNNIVICRQESYKYEGCGFNPFFHCPDTDCIYFKYAMEDPHCCHPLVDTHLEIGGISHCWGINNPNKKLLNLWNKIKNSFYD